MDRSFSQTTGAAPRGGVGSLVNRARHRVVTTASSIRLRLVWSFIAVLALATAASVLVVRQVSVERVNERIESDLRQEVDEVRRLAAGNDPESGEPFGGRVDRVFDVFLERNLPARHEALVTFVDGQLYRFSPANEPDPLGEQHVLYALHADPELVATWAAINLPTRGAAETPAGTVDYLAVPMVVDQVPGGVFVVAIFRDAQLREADVALVAAAIVGLVMLMIGSVLALRLADRILRPVRAVTRTARSISETDLTQRIAVSGHDEISELATTFNEMLERLQLAFTAQRRFIDDAGHELRTPITIIRGHLDVMGDDPEDRQRTLELVGEELERMSRMVEDLLTLARAEQPDFVRPKATDVDELTSRMLETARGLGDRDWRLEEVAAARADIDEQRVMQAVLQLAQNAVRHTQPGETIAMGSRIFGDELHFFVRDSGPGIAESERERVFQRFYRGRFGHSRTDGAGLGLSIVQAIAEAHGGRVELESAPGNGARFTVVVPLAPSGEEQ
jgi:two-component system OmpR family sensor kinase